MALLDELTSLQASLQTIVNGVKATAVDPATGLPVGAPLGQHDVPPAPVLTPAEVADRVEDASETVSPAGAVSTGTVTNADGSVTVTAADGSTRTTATDGTVTTTGATATLPQATPVVAGPLTTTNVPSSLGL
jgi:hypothetical protein